MATMTSPRPMTSGASRPAYLDGLFNRNSSGSASISSMSSAASTVSLSPSMSGLKSPSPSSSFWHLTHTRPLSPAFEDPDAFQGDHDGDDDAVDEASLRSKRSFFLAPHRRLRFGRIFSRRRGAPVDEVLEISDQFPMPPSSSLSPAFPSPTPNLARTSLPKARRLRTSHGDSAAIPHQPQHAAKASLTALATVAATAQELACNRCYYFAARHCHGWVLGGASGDACETCLQAGFFGAK